MDASEKAVDWALEIARDDSHGYDQSSRWGLDYDCSSLVISAYEAAGVPVKQNGATYTGNMRSAFKKCGFIEVTDGTLKPGDVLLNEIHHAALYIGGGQLVQASLNELGTVTGGATGDQTGSEISVRSYYSYPWDCVLRYQAVSDVQTMTADLPLLTIALANEVREDVKAFQHIHNLRFDSKIEVDGVYGAVTEEACRFVQQCYGLDIDGECGRDTWTALIVGK